MNRRALFSGIISAAVLGKSVKAQRSKAVFLGLGLTIGEFNWMYGEPTDIRTSGFNQSWYEFDDFYVTHNYPPDRMDVPLLNLFLEPKQLTDLEGLIDLCDGFLPSDVDRNERDEHDWGYGVNVTYFSDILRERISSLSNHEDYIDHGTIVVRCSRETSRPISYYYAEIEAPPNPYR